MKPTFNRGAQVSSLLVLLAFLSFPCSASPPQTGAHSNSAQKHEKRRPIATNEGLSGSVSFEVRGTHAEGAAFDKSAGGYATLVGIKALKEGQCRLVFLTAAHVLSQLDGFLFKEAILHSPLVPPVNGLRWQMHPEVLLNTKKGEIYRNDLALFSLEAPCPPVNVRPFTILPCEPGKRHCLFQQIKNRFDSELYPTSIELLPTRQFESQRLEEQGRPESFTLEPSPADLDSGFRFASGQSGTAVLMKDGDEHKIVGCFVATGDSPSDLLGRTTKDAIGLCHGGTGPLAWAAEELKKGLEGDLSWRAFTAGKAMRVPPGSVIHPTQTERERK